MMKRRLLALLFSLAFVACSGSERDPVQGTGGSGGSGGSGGTGGAGTQDEIAPALEILQPADEAVVTTAAVEVRGLAEDRGVVAGVQWSVNGGAAQQVAITEDTEVPFSFEAPLAPGENAIEIRALDRAGNEATRTLVVHREQGERVPPAIVEFTVDDESVLPGDAVTLSWHVTGSAPLTLRLVPRYPPPPGSEAPRIGERIDVSGRSSIEQVIEEQTEFTLEAANDLATATAVVRVEVARERPRIEPRDVVLVAGLEQRFRVANPPTAGGALGYTWSEGTQVDEAGLVVRIQKDQPGTHVLRVTDNLGLADEVQIEVIAAPAVRPIAPFEREAGSTVLSPLLGADGAFYALAAFDRALLRWDEQAARWRPIAAAPGAGNGTLQPGPGGVPLFLVPEESAWVWTGTAWRSEPLPPPGVWYPQPDGSVLLVRPFGNQLYRRPADGSTWDPIGPTLPAGFGLNAALIRADGSIHLAGTNLGGNVSFHWAAPATSWTNGPAPGGVALKLREDPAGRLFAFGGSLFELTAAGWIDVGFGLPAGLVRDVLVHPAGHLLAAVGGGLYSNAGGDFVLVAESAAPLGELSRRADGTLFATTPPRRLAPQSDEFVALHDRGLPTASGSIARGPQGIVASTGGAPTDAAAALYTGGATSAFVALGADALDTAVVDVASGSDGVTWVRTADHRLFRIDATGAVESITPPAPVAIADLALDGENRPLVAQIAGIFGWNGTGWDLLGSSLVAQELAACGDLLAARTAEGTVFRWEVVDWRDRVFERGGALPRAEQIGCTEDGTLWARTTAGIYRLDRQSQLWGWGAFGPLMTAIHATDDGTLLGRTADGLFELVEGSWAPLPHALPAGIGPVDPAWHLVFTDDGIWAAGTGTGLWRSPAVP